MRHQHQQLLVTGEMFYLGLRRPIKKKSILFNEGDLNGHMTEKPAYISNKRNQALAYHGDKYM